MPSPGDKRFIFCVHAHQPVGNFGFVMEEAFRDCYLPFVETAEKFPKIPVVFHFSGSLIDWLEKERPEFITRVAERVARGECEVLGGAYYEPIYGLIPENDLAEQILMMQDKVESLFGQRPQGVWLTERVWDPAILPTLATAGVRYTVLDDANFEMAGKRAPVTGSYHVSSEDGRSVEVFASSKALRYLIPFGEVADATRFIYNTSSAAGQGVAFADDMEKFGLWPGTHALVYGKRWLERFFEALQNEPGLALHTFSTYSRAHSPVGSVSIPRSSYGEMMEWSGGDFNNFFEKYPESRYMKERMQQVSHVLSNGARESLSVEEMRASKAALYRAQCNCPYWHGVFGGLYLHHLRSAIFENLIEAESATQPEEDVLEKLSFGSGDRWKLKQKDIISFFNPDCGGTLEEWDHLPSQANLTCTLQRRPEPYHRFVLPNTALFKKSPVFAIHKILGVKEKGLGKRVLYDPYRRLSLMDHFFDKAVTRKEFADSSYRERGDWVEGRYEATTEGCCLSLSRVGTLRMHGKKIPLSVRKAIQPRGDGAFHVRYEIRNTSSRKVATVFGVEFNFSIADASSGGGLEERGIRHYGFHDAWRDLNVRVSSEQTWDMVAAPVETVSESEGGMEGTYQQLSALFQRSLCLEAGQAESFDLTLTAESCHDRQKKS